MTDRITAYGRIYAGQRLLTSVGVDGKFGYHAITFNFTWYYRGSWLDRLLRRVVVPDRLVVNVLGVEKSSPLIRRRVYPGDHYTVHYDLNLEWQ